MIIMIAMIVVIIMAVRYGHEAESNGVYLHWDSPP
jgi:hypothetical protein